MNMRTKAGIAVTFLLVVAATFAAFGFFFRTALRPYQPQNTARVEIEVLKGQTPNQISRQLEAMQVIRDEKIFLYYGKLRGSWGKIKAGDYEFSPSMTPAQIFEVLMSGISIGRPFLVREGENSYEIADELQAKGFGPKERFIKLTRDPAFIATTGLIPAPKSLEGYLFPDTYMLQKKMHQEDILHLMVKRFLAAWGGKEELRSKELGMTRDQVVTLASIVEKETGAPEERPIIAGVFHNRLKKHMKLQSDPTTIYGMWSRYTGKIHKSDLSAANDFNTYYVAALPIWPISNPGIDAIEATLNPASHPYLYFVSKNNGTHIFTSTYEEHSKAVEDFQVNPKAREGHSWRELSKRKTAGTASTADSKSPKK